MLLGCVVVENVALQRELLHLSGSKPIGYSSLQCPHTGNKNSGSGQMSPYARRRSVTVVGVTRRLLGVWARQGLQAGEGSELAEQSHVGSGPRHKRPRGVALGPCTLAARGCEAACTSSPKAVGAWSFQGDAIHGVSGLPARVVCSSSGTGSILSPPRGGPACSSCKTTMLHLN